MSTGNLGSSNDRALPRVALLASQTQPAVTLSRVNSRPPTRPPSRTATVATVEVVPEPVETPATQDTLESEQSTTAPNPGDSSNIGTRRGADAILNATAARSICVRNDEDVETRINAQMKTLHSEVEGQKSAIDALMGEVQTLRQVVNRLLEKLGSLAAAAPQAQQPAVKTLAEVANIPDIQPMGEEQIAAVPRDPGPTAALAAQPQQAERSGLSELMDRLSRLEKVQSNNTSNGDSKRSKKGAKSKRYGKPRKTRRKRRDGDDDNPSSSSSNSSSDSDDSSGSEDNFRRNRRHKSPVSGAKRFHTRGPRHVNFYQKVRLSKKNFSQSHLPAGRSTLRANYFS